MNIQLFTPGTLRERALQYNLSCLESAKQLNIPMELEILTLKQYLTEQAVEEAWKKTPSTATINSIDTCVDQLMRTKYNTAKEFIKVQSDKMIIGVNADKINDAAIAHAVHLVSQLADTTPNQTIEFGRTIKIHIPQDAHYLD